MAGGTLFRADRIPWKLSGGVGRFGRGLIRLPSPPGAPARPQARSIQEDVRVAYLSEQISA